jgi:predicted component of viral defense system (DUF524 family)
VLSKPGYDYYIYFPIISKFKKIVGSFPEAFKELVVRDQGFEVVWVRG